MPDDYLMVSSGPPEPSSIYEPRVFSLPAGTERYSVEGGGAVLLALLVGDRITILNEEGGQPCEVLACDDKGRIDSGIIGTKGQGPALGLQTLLASSDATLCGLRMGLEARKIDAGGTGAVHLFEATTPAKTEQSFTAVRDGCVIIAAPAGMMDLEAQNTCTQLTVMIKRAVIKQTSRFELPTPLANPLRPILSKRGITSRFWMWTGGSALISNVLAHANWTRGSNMRSMSPQRGR